MAQETAAMSEPDDLAPLQARTSSAAVLITDVSPEGEAIGGTLRARGFDVEWVPLTLIEARIETGSPLVVVLDIDQPGAIPSLERIHALPGGTETTVLLIGEAVRSAELDPQLFDQIFERPVDVAELVAHVASIVEPARPHRPQPSTPPPSFLPPRPATGRPVPLESEGPLNSDFPAEIDAIDVGSVLPLEEQSSDSVPPQFSPAQISPELEQLLAAAEHRVHGSSRPSSIPSADDNVDLMLSAELLVALDEPLDPEEENEGITGSGASIATHGYGSRLTAGDDGGAFHHSGPRFSITGSVSSGSELSSPGDTPWGHAQELSSVSRASEHSRVPDMGTAGSDALEASPWSRNSYISRGIWAQGSPFRGMGNLATEGRREPEAQSEEPSQGAALTLKGVPSMDPRSIPAGVPSAEPRSFGGGLPTPEPRSFGAAAPEPRSFGAAAPEPRSFGAAAAPEPRSFGGGRAGMDHRPATRRTGADDHLPPPRTTHEASVRERPSQPNFDDERWAGGTRDEGDARRVEVEQEEHAGRVGSRESEIDQALSVYMAGSGAARATGGAAIGDRPAPSHAGAPLVSPPRDVRVRSFSDALEAPPSRERPPEGPDPRSDPRFAQRPPKPAPIERPALDSRRGSMISDLPSALPPSRPPLIEEPGPRGDMEGPPSSTAEPAITVLGPGDAPRALARAVGSRSSGSLAITTEAGTRRIVLHEGDIVTAASEVPEEALLTFLAARGDLSREVAGRLSGKLPPSGRHAGAALIAHGHLGQDDLWPVLRAHAEWIIGHVALIEGGGCELEEEPPGRLKAEPNVFGGATGAEVFVETIRRVISPEVALRRLGGAMARLDDGVRRGLIGECALRSEEEELVRSARGRAVAEIVDATEPEMATLLYALVCLEVLDVLIPPSASEAPRPILEDPLDEEAIRQRVRARLALVQDGDYFAVLGIARDATNYEIRRAYLTLRRAFEPSRLLTAATVDLLSDVRLVIEVLDEAYEILREPHRRERYRRAIEAPPP